MRVTNKFKNWPTICLKKYTFYDACDYYPLYSCTHVKCTKYETCSKLHRFHILYISHDFIPLNLYLKSLEMITKTFRSVSSECFLLIYHLKAVILFGRLSFPSHLGKYIIKNGKISTKIHDIGKIKANLGLGMTPL